MENRTDFCVFVPAESVLKPVLLRIRRSLDLPQFYMRHLWFSFLALAGLHSASTLRAENWPQWRGPRLDGTSLDQGFPTAMSEKNVLWQAELPGEGHASPIVW